MEYQVKGTLVLGYLKHLESIGASRHVREKLHPRSQTIFERPPAITDWIAGEILEDLVNAVHDYGGPGAVRVMVSQSLNGTVSRFLRPLGESILRLFGATPHSLFSRIETINAPIFRGLSYRYEKLGENSCDVEVTFPRPPSHPAIIAWDEALSMIVEGTAGKRPNISVSTRENSLRWNFSLRW